MHNKNLSLQPWTPAQPPLKIMTWDDSKMIPTLGKGTTRLKHREKKYHELAILYGTVNNMNDVLHFC